MGLTAGSTGRNAVDGGLNIHKKTPEDLVVAIAGNPNVGKSTLFNALTGMHQHTGNWPGKTVASAQGRFSSPRHSYVMVDIPGTYSLLAHSPEEEVARDFLCFHRPDVCIVICDATCLKRSMALAIQILEITGRVILCVNLMDEAEARGIRIDLKRLEAQLGVPVVGVVARQKKSLRRLKGLLDQAVDSPPSPVRPLPCPTALQPAVDALLAHMPSTDALPIAREWLALRLLDSDASLVRQIATAAGWTDQEQQAVHRLVAAQKARLREEGIHPSRLQDWLVSGLRQETQRVLEGCISQPGDGGYCHKDRRLDKILTGRITAFPVMLLLLALLFWITISGANLLSGFLSDGLFRVQDWLSRLFMVLNSPPWLHDLCVLGVYRTLAWVVSVMLPPMAIFFPLFTLLEDSGYLPRIAYNLDRPFEKCCACGKQSLCMAMGLGCNAAGVVGCRIIDSPRERLIAILTNSFIPCNGRLPILLSILSMFFVTASGGLLHGLYSALILLALLMLSIGVTFLTSRLLSKTLLKGVPSSFALEMPPYRRPQLGKVIVRSVFDRVLFVLGRAVAVAAPAGLVLWLCANLSLGGSSLLTHLCALLDGPGWLMGMDGAILVAFLLGFPASEIVLPIVLMAYLSTGMLMEPGSALEMHQVLVSHGWTWLTAANVLLFTLFHWPCSTTLLTIRKETASWKWTALAFLIPTVIGCGLCMAFTAIVRLLGLA